MKLKKNYIIIIAIACLVVLATRVNTADYLAWAVQSITQDFEYDIDNKIKISTPEGWIVSDFFTEETGHLLYGLVPYDNKVGLTARCVVYVEFTEPTSGYEVVVYQLKKNEIPEDAYSQKERTYIFNNITGYILKEQNTRTVYFPNENMMVVGAKSNIEDYFAKK